jgi:hypothetical protein
MGPYIRQDKHQFYYTVCKCTNNIREANEWLTMIGKSSTQKYCHGYSDKLEYRYTRGTRESVLCWNSPNSNRASGLDWTRARKTLSNPNGFRQSRESSGPQNLTTLSVSLSTQQEWTWEHYRGLNLTFFTLSTRGSTGVFIGGVRRCSGQRLGTWGPLVRLTGHETWPGGHV